MLIILHLKTSRLDLTKLIDVECDENTVADIKIINATTMQKYSSVFKSKELLEIGFR